LRKIEKQKDAGRLNLRYTDAWFLRKKRRSHGPKEEKPNWQIKAGVVKAGFSNGNGSDQPS
jgi:hypothetical protein